MAVQASKRIDRSWGLVTEQRGLLLPACKHVMESKVASKAAESGRQNTDARKSITS